MSQKPQAMAEVRALLAARPGPEASLEERRNALEDLAARFPLPEGVAVEVEDAGGIAARRFVPAGGAADAVVLYFHGGAYAIGSSLSHGELTARLAQASGVPVLSIDYRRAPEHPFPAAPEDCLRAYRSVLDAGVEAARLSLAGDSAGGALVLATLLQIREQDLPLPAAAACISPWVDLTHSGASFTALAARDPFLQPEALELAAATYLAGADPRHRLASPLFADLAGLPPLVIQVGSDEILLDDARRLHDAALGAGVHSELEIWDDMFHVWHLFGSMLDDGMRATQRLGQFLAAAVA